MALRDEIKHYRDRNGYINPNVVNITQGRHGENDTIYTSEYYILLAKRQEDRANDVDEWEILINKSSVVPGLTLRYPGDYRANSTDNLLGILAAAKVLNKPNVAEDIFSYGFWNCGFYIPNHPNHMRTQAGMIDLAYFQFKHPELVFAMICAAGIYKEWKILYWPLALYTAICIMVSCIGVNKYNTHPRRITWLLIQAVQSSWLCRKAANLWFARLHRDYGDMRAVAAEYYQPSHPFIKYWVN